MELPEYFIADFSPQLFILLDVLIAAILCGIIGIEREKADKPAGFRTNMLIGASAALLVSLGRVIIKSYDETIESGFLEADPIRIIQAIVIGVSFIGAGTILKDTSSSHIRFLTTSATVLLSAGIGITIAVHQYILGVGITLLVLIINAIIKYLYKY